jgi:hypothetical protein
MGPTTTRRLNSTRAGRARISQHDTQSRRGPTKVGSSKEPPIRTVLGDIRLHLGVAEAVAAIASTALKFQGADCDEDVATAIQRCVCDVLSAQIARLEAVIAGGVS